MSENSIVDPSRLTKVISSLLPKLGQDEIDSVQSNLMDYIANGLEEGFDVALIKGQANTEIRIRILNLKEKFEKDEYE